LAPCKLSDLDHQFESLVRTQIEEVSFKKIITRRRFLGHPQLLWYHALEAIVFRRQHAAQYTRSDIKLSYVSSLRRFRFQAQGEQPADREFDEL
jgi:hypothetical protein